MKGNGSRYIEEDIEQIFIRLGKIEATLEKLKK